MSREQWDELYERHWAWVMQEFPESATRAGVADASHDRWTDWSPEAVHRRKDHRLDLLEKARLLARDDLDDKELLHAELFIYDAAIAAEAESLPLDLLQISPLGGVHQSAANLIAMMPTATASQRQVILARLAALPAHVDQHIELLREGMARGVTQPKVVMRDIPEHVANVAITGDASPFVQPHLRADPGFVDGLREVVARQVAPAFERLHGFLVDTYLPGAREDIACCSLPDGEVIYDHLIRARTTTSMSAAEIHELGQSEVKRIRLAMDEVIASAGFTGSFNEWTEFLRTAPQFFHTDAESLLREYRDISKRADPELARMFGTLPRLPYGVTPVPTYAERSQTTAYYMRGAPSAGRPAWFYANTYDLASRPRWEMEALTLHEAVPGHHLQIALAQEMEGVPEFRKWPAYTAYVEGWGLYAESLGEEMGFYADPYSKFGQLTYEMWRAVRLVVDTGMHALGWTRDQAIVFFEEHTAKARHDIVVEIDRYIAWPAQALAYKIGELKLKALRAHATEVLGEAFDIRTFHDAVLLSGALPLDVLDSHVRSWVSAQPT